MDWNLFIAISFGIGSLIAVVFTSAMWLSKEFSKVRSLVYDKTEQLKEFIVEKLEYHEKHDDSRFIIVHNDLLAIKLRNAAIDGKIVADSRKIPTL